MHRVERNARLILLLDRRVCVGRQIRAALTVMLLLLAGDVQQVASISDLDPSFIGRRLQNDFCLLRLTILLPIIFIPEEHFIWVLRHFFIERKLDIVFLSEGQYFLNNRFRLMRHHTELAVTTPSPRALRLVIQPLLFAKGRRPRPRHDDVVLPGDLVRERKRGLGRLGGIQSYGSDWGLVPKSSNLIVHGQLFILAINIPVQKLPQR